MGAVGAIGCFSESVTAPDPAATATYAAVSVGAEHTCAVDIMARALCWGENQAGQLGLGDTDRRLVPAVVQGPSFASIAAGGGHTCGIATDGWTYCWGTSLFGQMGNGTTGLAGSTTPVRTSGDHQFVAIGAGDAHTCGLTLGGVAWCWGLDFDGRLGRGLALFDTIFVAVPDSVRTDELFVAITAGDRHTCALTAAGAAYCWGSTARGQVGDGTEGFPVGFRLIPTPVAGGHTFAQIDAGRLHTCGVTTAGAVLCWGAGEAGQIGDGQRADRMVPTAAASSETFVRVAAGGDHTCAVASDDRLWCWGRTQVGSIGDNTVEERLTPALVPGSLTAFRDVVAGDRASGATNCGLGPDDVLYCWGWGRNGQIGNADIYDQPEPTRVAGQP